MIGEKVGVNVYTWFAVMLTATTIPLIFIFGYAILEATICVFSILAIGLVCQILRTIYLFKTKLRPHYRIILEISLTIVYIILACILTNAKVTYTATGFILEQENLGLYFIIFLPFWLANFVLQAKTNQKIGKLFKNNNGKNEKVN